MSSQEHRIFLVDASSSMGPYWDAAKENTIGQLQACKKGDQVTIYTFATEIKTIFEGDATQGGWEELIEKLLPVGSTCLNRILAQTKKTVSVDEDKKYIIVVLSDGENTIWDDNHKRDEELETARKNVAYLTEKTELWWVAIGDNAFEAAKEIYKVPLDQVIKVTANSRELRRAGLEMASIASQGTNDRVLGMRRMATASQSAP